MERNFFLGRHPINKAWPLCDRLIGFVNVEKEKNQKENSDRGNRTPGCRVRDGDVSHYTISDIG
ncbi:hypothetical protein N7517_000121 [Penicillium concentricum]|uniref:Uncharacterized protein n=1 Tax=Penicillium concentricum TaxID=293559 RepID=A0A9W9VJY6_9EURO|nr:uncharacterized protein N7517_000121 [Penicillium concentricum]KAJ5382210.1 hypothetical protein N7517_000121 [Penicillium concentricum]